MPLVTGTLSLQDAAGKKSTVTLFTTDDGFTITQLRGWLEGAATIIKALTGAAITSASLCLNVSLTGVATFSDEARDVEEGGLWVMQSEDGHYRRTRIPAILDELIDDTSRDVDRTDAAVIAFETMLDIGVDVAGTTVPTTNNYGSPIDSVLSARENFQSSRKR